ncbi:MAG: sigma-70 family RNA polymerase sigma factor [Nocardioidaceae bacterium]
MDDLAEQFEAQRTRLRAVAYRLLGSVPEADDAVQEAWLRLSRQEPGSIDNLPAWLTTVVSRISLDQLRARGSRREDPLEYADLPATEDESPEALAEQAGAVGAALSVVLDELAPAERLAFVLHDVFAVPFDQIAGVIDKTPAATRQLASRARRRLQGAEQPREQARQRDLVEAFLAASKEGEFDRLLRLLDPDAVVRVDAAVVKMGGVPAQGAAAVANVFSGRARAVRLVLVDGLAGAVWQLRGVPQVVFDFTVVGDRIVAIDQIADPDMLAAIEIAHI